MKVSSNADSKVIWMDGELVPYEKAQVHVLSHTLHYGTGAFEGMRTYKTFDGKSAIFRAEDHMKRFVESVSSLGLVTPYAVSDLVGACAQTVQANRFEECYVRPLAYLGDSIRGLKVPQASKVNVAIATWPWGKYLNDDGTKGIRIMTSTYRRADVATSLPMSKLTGSYITSVLARREASLAGMDEALLLDPIGCVAEGSGENLFWIKDGKMVTPPKTYILPGLTRDCIFQIAHTLGIEIKEEPITRNQLYLADELFFTGTAAEVTPIREVDHRMIKDGSPGPITKKLSDLYFKAVRGELSEFRHWLTYV